MSVPDYAADGGRGAMVDLAARDRETARQLEAVVRALIKACEVIALSNDPATVTMIRMGWPRWLDRARALRVAAEARALAAEIAP